MACLALAGAVASLAGPAVPPAAAQDGTVVGRPDFQLVLIDGRVAPGETATLSAVLVNDARVFRGGDPRTEARVTTAFNVSIRPLTERLRPRLARALDFRTRLVPLGTVRSGVSDRIALDVAVGWLPPGEYRVPFAVTYSYAALAQPNETVTLRTRTETLTARLTVEAEPRLRLTTPPNQSVAPGGNRVVRFAVTNAGTARATELGLTLSTDIGSVYFGSALDRRSEVGFYVPSLAPGETETVRVRAGAGYAAEAGTALVTGRATYRDETGQVEEAAWLATGLNVTNGGNATSNVGGESADRRATGAYSSGSPAPSRTMTAIPVSKSAIPSAESSARPTASSDPSSWTTATSSPGLTSGPTAATNLAKTFRPSRTNGSLSSPTTTRPAGGSSAAATRRPPARPSVNRPSVP